MPTKMKRMSDAELRMNEQLSAAQRLQELDTLRATGAVSDDEYARQRQQIISEI